MDWWDDMVCLQAFATVAGHDFQRPHGVVVEAAMPLAAQPASVGRRRRFGIATPSSRAPERQAQVLLVQGDAEAELKVRLTIRSPCTSSTRLAAKRSISATVPAGSAPALLANSGASPTAAMFSATMI